MKTTYREILNFEPCIESVNKVLVFNGFDEINSHDDIPQDIDLDKDITFSKILDICGIEDAIWCLRVLDYKDYCLFLADVAELVLPIYEKYCPRDNRPRKCIETIRLYHAGKKNNNELNAARNAAWDAAWAATDAAWDATDAAWDARDAARAAAWDAAWAAATDAATDAAWAATDAAWAAAWAATDAAWAATDAAWDATDAARAAAWDKIEKIFRRHFGKN